MTKLPVYFGIIGMASIAAWVAALVLMGLYAWRHRSAVLARLALVLAAGGLILATINSRAVSALRAFPTPEAGAADKGPAAPDRRRIERTFIEQSEADKRALNTAGKAATTAPAAASSGASAAAPVAAAPTAAAPASEPATEDPFDYRKAGKQQREGGKARERFIEAAASQPAGSAAEAVKAEAARMLPSADVDQANHLDRLNLAMARFAIWAAVVALVLDYLRRHNVTFARLVPVPLSLRTIEAIFPKSPAVLVERCGDPVALARSFAAHALSKGETFFFLGDVDPFADEALPRLVVGRAFWKLDRLVYDAQPSGVDRRFVLEAVWYGRACACAVGQAPCDDILRGIEALLSGGVTTPPVAPRTVNLIWCAEAPPRDQLVRLVRAAGAANVRIVLLAAGQVAPDLRAAFHEIHPDAAKLTFAAPALDPLLAALDRLVTRVARFAPVRH